MALNVFQQKYFSHYNCQKYTVDQRSSTNHYKDLLTPLESTSLCNGYNTFIFKHSPALFFGSSQSSCLQVMKLHLLHKIISRRALISVKILNLTGIEVICDICARTNKFTLLLQPS